MEDGKVTQSKEEVDVLRVGGYQLRGGGGGEGGGGGGRGGGRRGRGRGRGRGSESTQ